MKKVFKNLFKHPLETSGRNRLNFDDRSLEDVSDQ